jgi:hypothetical protein
MGMFLQYPCGDLPKGYSRDLIMAVNVKEIRRLRLRDHIAARYEGNQTAFAKKIKRPPPNVSRWLSTTAKDKRGIEEATAREIEAIDGLALGSLDRIEDEPPSSKPLPTNLTTDEREVLTVWRTLLEEQRIELRVQLREAGERAERTVAEIKRRGLDHPVSDAAVGRHIAPAPKTKQKRAKSRPNWRTV